MSPLAKTAYFIPLDTGHVGGIKTNKTCPTSQFVKKPSLLIDSPPELLYFFAAFRFPELGLLKVLGWKVNEA